MIEEIQKQHLEAIENSEELIILKGMVGSEYKVDNEKASRECTKVTLQAIIDVLKDVLKVSQFNDTYTKSQSYLWSLEDKLKDLQ